jgi:hypothetical protein
MCPFPALQRTGETTSLVVEVEQNPRRPTGNPPIFAISPYSHSIINRVAKQLIFLVKTFSYFPYAVT